MKKKLLFGLMIFVAFRLGAQCASDANIYTFNYDGKTYEVVKEMKSWDDAAACAVERGGYLVEIGSQAEQDAVYDAIINGAGVASNYTTISNGGGIAYVWIGATDNGTEGDWQWDGDNDGTGTSFWSGTGGTGSAVGGAFVNWGGSSQGSINEPDNYGSGQDHGAIGLAGWPSGTTMLGSTAEWNDIKGSSLCYFVIEKDDTGIEDEKKKQKITVFPNPTSGELKIEATKVKSVELISITGKVLASFSDTTINIGSYDKGLYILRITTSSGVLNKKVVLR